MLGKLVKHEWRSTWKIGTLLMICIAALTLVSCLALRMPFLYGAMSGESNPVFGILDVMGILTLIVYVFAMMGVTYGLMIYLGIHFYKSMYTDEGYLTHTLPVTHHQLLIAKTLVSGIWMILMNLVLILSIVVLAYTAVCMYMNATPADVTGVLGEAIAEGFSMMPDEIKSKTVLFVVMLIFLLLLSPFCSMLMLFGSITLGQLFTKHRAIMAIVCYIGVSFVCGIFSSVVSMITSFRYMFREMASDVFDEAAFMLDFYSGTYGIQIVVLLLTGALLYFVSHLILQKKFDIE